MPKAFLKLTAHLGKRALFWTLALLLCLRWVVRAYDDYNVVRLGFYGAGYTSSTGLQISSFTAVDDGFVLGQSARYSGAASMGDAVWVADTGTGISIRIGLFGAGYTRADGFQSSLSTKLDGGYAGGTSAKYSGSTSLGRAAWVANASTGETKRVGLIGGAFQMPSGYEFSQLELLSGGFASGYSQEFSPGGSDLGQAAWVADVATAVTTRIGLFDALYTRSDGYRYSSANNLDGGYVAGVSTKYSGMTDLGNSAWVAVAATGVTTRIGLFDSGYTMTGGYQHSTINPNLMSGGYVIGTSLRFSGVADRGQAAWVANAATGVTTRIGLTDAGHSQLNNYQFSYAYLLNGGYAGGYSLKYNALGTEIGQSAFVANVTTGVSTKVGLVSSTFSKPTGYQHSSVSYLNGSFSTGISEIYNNTSTLAGYAGWVANNSTGVTTRIGLFTPGSEYVRPSDSYQSTHVAALSGSTVAGTSDRYTAGSADAGKAAWVAGAISGTTNRIGLTTGVYNSSAGYQSSTVTGLIGNYVAGSSNRYNGTTQVGTTAWVYELSTLEISPIVLSFRPSDNYSFSSIYRIYESGLALGYYSLFSGETNLGFRAFAWTPETDAFDIASASNNSISSVNLASLTQAQFADAYDNIIGTAAPLGASGSAVFLTMIPEPGSAWLFLSAAGWLISRRPRRRAEFRA